jgi:hypothetical protein
MSTSKAIAEAIAALPRTRIVYGTATGDNTVPVEGDTTAVEMPAIAPVKSGDYCAVAIPASGDRIILGPVDKATIVDGWTPGLTDLNLGSTGTQSGHWRWSNGVFEGWWYGILGGAGLSVGTTPKFTLPTGISLLAASFRVPLGEAQLLDGFTPWSGIIRRDSATSVSVAYWTGAGTVANVTSTAPFTWASGDAIGIKVSAPATYTP